MGSLVPGGGGGLPRAWRWTVRHAGRRGAFLAFLTILDLSYGYSLVTAPAALQRATDLLLPWPAWGWIWIASGVVAASGIFLRYDRFQYGFAATFKAAWGLLYADLWVVHGLYRGWVATVIWLGLAAVVLVIAGWPEPGRSVLVPPPANLTDKGKP